MPTKKELLANLKDSFTTIEQYQHFLIWLTQYIPADQIEEYINEYNPDPDHFHPELIDIELETE